MQLQALFSVYLNDFIPFASVSSPINHQPDGMADSSPAASCDTASCKAFILRIVCPHSSIIYRPMPLRGSEWSTLVGYKAGSVPSASHAPVVQLQPAH